jgi:hypothetical protein
MRSWLEPSVGFEPTTCCLQNSCSATELRRQTFIDFIKSDRPGARSESAVAENAVMLNIGGVIQKFLLVLLVLQPGDLDHS